MGEVQPSLPHELTISMTAKAREQAAEQGVLTISGNRVALDGLARAAGIALPPRRLHVLLRGHSQPVAERWDPIYMPRLVDGHLVTASELPELTVPPDFNVVIKNWRHQGHIRDIFAQQLLNGDLWKEASRDNRGRPWWSKGFVRQVAPEIGRAILANQDTLGSPLEIVFNSTPPEIKAAHDS